LHSYSSSQLVTCIRRHCTLCSLGINSSCDVDDHFRSDMTVQNGAICDISKIRRCTNIFSDVKQWPEKI